MRCRRSASRVIPFENPHNAAPTSLQRFRRIFPAPARRARALGVEQDRVYVDHGFTGSEMAAIGRCEHVCASISAIECVLGRDWTVDTARPWVETVIDHFGPGRCMLGSHLPISRLSYSFSARAPGAGHRRSDDAP